MNAKCPVSAARPNGVPQRTKLADGYFQQENETLDVFMPIIGVHSGAVLSALVRCSYGKAEVQYSTRTLKEMTGMSRTTAARSIQILAEIGLIERLPTSGNQKSRCILKDLKALALSYGASIEGKRFFLPPATLHTLKEKVKELGEKQQNKHPIATEARSGISSEMSPGDRLDFASSVSQRDTSVSLPICERRTRETQGRLHLIRKKERTEQHPIPALSLSSGKQADESIPDKDGAREPQQPMGVQLTESGTMRKMPQSGTSSGPVHYLSILRTDYEFSRPNEAPVFSRRRINGRRTNRRLPPAQPGRELSDSEFAASVALYRSREIEAYKMWLGMTDNYRRENPMSPPEGWKGDFESGGG